MVTKVFDVRVGHHIWVPAGWTVHHSDVPTLVVSESAGSESSSAGEDHRSKVSEDHRDE